LFDSKDTWHMVGGVFRWRVEFGRDYTDAFPNGRFEHIRNAAHIPASEAPDGAFRTIDNFLAKS
jgi:hypothetical protein